MTYSDLIDISIVVAKEQTEDKALLEYYSAEEIKMNLLKHIQHVIKSEAIILSKDELLQKCKEYHNYIDFYPEHLPY